MLTASLFLGDFAGPSLPRIGTDITRHAALAFGIGIGLVGSLVMVGSSESHYCRVPHATCQQMTIRRCSCYCCWSYNHRNGRPRSHSSQPRSASPRCAVPA
jgi:hypothetical protein